MFLVSMQFLPPLHLMCVLCTIHWTELYRSLRALGEKWYVESIVFYYVNYYCFKVGQPIHHKSHQSCGWLKGQSQSVHKIDICTIYLYLNNKKKKFSPYLIRNKNKFLHSLQGFTYNLGPHCQHTDKTTHKISEKFMYGFVLHYFNSSLLTFDIENSNLAILTFSQYWAQFQKAQLTPYKTRCAFFYSPLGQGAMSTNLLTVITSRLELSYLLTSTTTGNDYKAKQSPFYMSLYQRILWWYPSSSVLVSLSSMLTNFQAHRNSTFH